MTGLNDTVNDAVNEAQEPGAPTVSKNLSKNLRKPLDAGFKRNLKIVGFTLAGFGAAIALLFVLNAGKKNDGARSEMAMAGTVVPNDAPMPKPYQDKLDRVETKESTAAMANGQSYVPPPGNDGTQPVGQPVQPVGVQQVNYVPPVQAQNANQQIPDGLRLQLQRIVAAMGPQQPQQVDAKLEKETLLASGSKDANAARAASDPVVSRTKVVDKEAIYAAKVSNVPSSDRGGLTFVEITSGPLKGALLQGRSTLYNSEYLNTKFTSMRLNNKQYDIDAIALDEQTAEDALDGKIDHKILTRYVMPVLFAGLQAYAAARAETGTYAAYPTTTTVGSTFVTNAGIATPAPNTTQAINAGIAQGLSIANQNISKLASAPPDVSLPQNLAIGVMFTAPVYEQ